MKHSTGGKFVELILLLIIYKFDCSSYIDYFNSLFMPFLILHVNKINIIFFITVGFETFIIGKFILAFFGFIVN